MQYALKRTKQVAMTQYTGNYNLHQLVAGLSTSPVSPNVLQGIISFLKHRNNQSLPLTNPQFIQPLLTLQRWTWQLLSRESHQWIQQHYYLELLYNVASFNKQLTLSNDTLDIDFKAKLLFSVTIEQINQIFNNLDHDTDDNSTYFNIINLFLYNHSQFLIENPQYASPVIDYIGQCIISRYTLSERYKLYLAQLRQTYLTDAILTHKFLFYISTCSFGTSSYLMSKYYEYELSNIGDHMMEVLRDDLIEIVRIQSTNVSMWSKKLLSCIANIMCLIVSYIWCEAENKTKAKMIFPTEKHACDHLQNLIEILLHRQFHQEIKYTLSNDETKLVSCIITIILLLLQTYNVSWLFRENVIVRETINSLAENSINHDISLCSYHVLGEVLTDEQLKELKFADHAGNAFFFILQQLWNQSIPSYKRISVNFLLKGTLK